MPGRFEDGLTDSRPTQRTEQVLGAKHRQDLKQSSRAKHEQGLTRSSPPKHLQGLTPSSPPKHLQGLTPSSPGKHPQARTGLPTAKPPQGVVQLPTSKRLRGLEHLPTLEPPAHLEATTLDAMARASAAPRASRPADGLRPSLRVHAALILRERAYRRLVALAAGWVAAIAIGVLLAVLAPMSEAPQEPEPERVAAEEAYRGLLEQSEYLERLLTELPQRQVMRVSTAGTIVGLEERLALIDAELSRQEASTESPTYRLALMRDRVDTMSALVTVRYTQSPAFSY